jgi:hypothetical protein
MLSKQQTVAIVKHLRAVADILENSKPVDNKSAATAAPTEKSKRGRKPGAVADAERCQGTNGNGEQCKNRATQGTHCGKHT